MLFVLALMALADAYGFWNTLTRLVQRDTYFVLGFVTAVAFGAVAAAHQLGRLGRSRREGYGGSLIWMAVLAMVWLAVGGTIAWLRTQDPMIAAPRGTGALAGTQAPQGIDPDSLRLAILLLGLYLLTGMLAMTHAYQYRDPRSAEIREAQRDREQMARLAARRRFEMHLKTQDLAIQKDRIRREEEALRRRVSEKEACGEQLETQVVQDIARHCGDPSATDGLTQSRRPPTPPPEPRST